MSSPITVQSDLFTRASHTKEWIEKYLNENARVPVEITVTRNRSSMLSIEFIPNGLVRVRMHEGFLQAPDDIFKLMRLYIRTRRRAAWLELAAYARSLPAIPAPVKNKIRVKTQGKVYDLKELQKDVNLQFFQGNSKCRITWGRVGPRKSRRRIRSICWGSYDTRHKLIRIHPYLDHPAVPYEFIRYIIYHEMLHDCIPPEARKGRTYHHHRIFKQMDRKFPNWEKMQDYSKKLPGKISP